MEDECGVGRDVGVAAFAVGEGGGDGELPFGAGVHELEGFGPAFDDAADAEGGGCAAFVGTVKLGAVYEGAAVVHGDGVVGLGAFAAAGGEDFVLEAAGEGDDAGLGFVVGEEFFAGDFVFIAGDFAFFNDGLLEGLQGFADLLFGELSGGAGGGVLDAAGEGIGVEEVGFQSLPPEIAADVDAEGVAGFFLFTFEDGRRDGGGGSGFGLGVGGGLAGGKSVAGERHGEEREEKLIFHVEDISETRDNWQWNNVASRQICFRCEHSLLFWVKVVRLPGEEQEPSLPCHY